MNYRSRQWFRRAPLNGLPANTLREVDPSALDWWEDTAGAAQRERWQREHLGWQPSRRGTVGCALVALALLAVIAWHTLALWAWWQA